MFRRTPNVEKSARPKPGRRRWWFIGGLVALPVIVLGVLLVLLPTIVRLGLVYSLEQRGYVTRVAAVETDLLAGRLSASDIRLRDEQVALTLKQAGLTFDWSALLDKQLRVIQVSLKGLSVDTLAETTPYEPGLDDLVREPDQLAARTGGTPAAGRSLLSGGR